MLDEELRAQLADWVAPLAGLPAPGIRVLRQRTRRRRARWGAGIVMSGAVVATAVTIGTLPGPGRPAVPGGSAAAPGTWYPGRWFAAGKLPAADASVAAAPYVVTISHGGEVVTHVLTGATAGTEGPPPGASFAAVKAAGDDRTFMLAARAGASVDFYEQRLGPAGRPGPPVLIFTLPASSVPAFALSPDASQLAYATPGGIRVVSLATGAGRSWTAAGGKVVGLSWAGGKALAFTWMAVSAGQVQSVTVRLLATTVPGTRLMASRQLVPVCANSVRLLCVESGSIGTADGSKVFVTNVFNHTGAVAADVEEFTGSTRHTVLSTTIQAGALSAITDTTCAVLWTDPSGQHLAAYCGHWVTIDDGHVRAASLHVPAGPLTQGGQLIAW